MIKSCILTLHWVQYQCFQFSMNPIALFIQTVETCISLSSYYKKRCRDMESLEYNLFKRAETTLFISNPDLQCPFIVSPC